MRNCTVLHQRIEPQHLNPFYYDPDPEGVVTLREISINNRIQSFTHELLLHQIQNKKMFLKNQVGVFNREYVQND